MHEQLYGGDDVERPGRRLPGVPDDERTLGHLLCGPATAAGSRSIPVTRAPRSIAARAN
jgi:hypothetical protein